MPHSFKLSRRFARLRAPVLFTALVLAFIGCDSTESLDPNSSLTPEATDQIGAADIPLGEDEAGVQSVPVGGTTLASASFAGGIPIGMAAQPISAFGRRFNGGKLAVGPEGILKALAEVRSRGGKIAVMLAGNPRYYKDSDGHFSLTKWKARIDRFKGINLGPYISDGTIVGHFLIDEPNDARNWRGRAIPASVVEEMARHSKQLWSGMATIVRVEPSYLSGNHRYLDAAWAQYLARRGNVNDYLRQNVADAQKRGLALVVGLNVLDGGTPQGTRMTASEVEQWGSAMLNSSYPCAFIMWQHNSDYLSSGGVGSAMDALRRKAENRSSRSCRS